MYLLSNELKSPRSGQSWKKHQRLADHLWRISLYSGMKVGICSWSSIIQCVSFFTGQGLRRPGFPIPSAIWRRLFQSTLWIWSIFYFPGKPIFMLLMLFFRPWWLSRDLNESWSRQAKYLARLDCKYCNTETGWSPFGKIMFNLGWI